jgi:hypothetical protein
MFFFAIYYSPSLNTVLPKQGRQSLVCKLISHTNICFWQDAIKVSVMQYSNYYINNIFVFLQTKRE